MHAQTGSLGHGTFGIVIKALDLRSEPPTEVAIKLLPRGDFVRPLPTTPATMHLRQGCLVKHDILRKHWYLTKS